MRVKRREILAAVVLGLALILVAYYFSMVNETAYKPFYGKATFQDGIYSLKVSDLMRKDLSNAIKSQLKL